jgi:hypothetical protein
MEVSFTQFQIAGLISLKVLVLLIDAVIAPKLNAVLDRMFPERRYVASGLKYA